MHYAHISPTAPRPTRARPVPVHEACLSADRQFMQMLEAFRSTGGVAPVEEVGQLLQRHLAHHDNALLEWIAQRDVICFEWQDRRWIPWFQFNRHSLQPHRQLRPVLAELNAVYDPWELGNWFAMPNPWLADCLPVDLLVADLPGVLLAARADRFIANG